MIDFNDTSQPAVAVRYDLDAIVSRLRDTAHAWVPGMFPNGRRQGDEWRLANIRGDAPRESGSCVITLKGDHAGDWHDFDGGEGGGPLSTLEQGTRLTGRALFARAADMVGWSGAPPARQEPPPTPKPERDHTQEIRFILDHAIPLPGSMAEAYLRQRGLEPPVGDNLQFHPDLTHWETKTGYPAMVATVRGDSGAIVAVHRTYLAADEQEPDRIGKAQVSKPRMMLGKTGGGAVHLAPIGADGFLGLSEGIETGLAVMTACPGLPVWATLSTSGMEQVQLPPEARHVLILADHDASGAGVRAADTLLRRLRREGRHAAIVVPPEPGDDFNDLLLRNGPTAVGSLVRAAATQPDQQEQEPSPTVGRHLPVGFKDLGQNVPQLRADEGDLKRAVNRAWTVLYETNNPPGCSVREGSQAGSSPTMTDAPPSPC